MPSFVLSTIHYLFITIFGSSIEQVEIGAQSYTLVSNNKPAGMNT